MGKYMREQLFVSRGIGGPNKSFTFHFFHKYLQGLLCVQVCASLRMTVRHRQLLAVCSDSPLALRSVPGAPFKVPVSTWKGRSWPKVFAQCIFQYLDNISSLNMCGWVRPGYVGLLCIRSYTWAVLGKSRECARPGVKSAKYYHTYSKIVCFAMNFNSFNTIIEENAMSSPASSPFVPRGKLNEMWNNIQVLIK